MQHRNINKVDIVDSKSTAILVSDFQNVISDIGIDITYYFFNKNFNDWVDIVSMKGYVMSQEDETAGSFDVKDKYTILISAESFHVSDTLVNQPNKKDKIKIGSYDYHITDIYFYNVQAELVNTINNAMAVGLEVIRKGGFSRNDLIR